MLERIKFLINERKSFAFETTLSGLAYLKTIQYAKFSGYDIILFFVWLNNPNLTKERVAARVNKGGHNIPENIIEEDLIRE